MVEALRGAGEEFGSFDILSDEAVRQGLKVGSALSVGLPALAWAALELAHAGALVRATAPNRSPLCFFSALLNAIITYHQSPYCSLRPVPQDYSNWPTYPQLFVKGELLGGCDIVAELQVSSGMGGRLEEVVVR